MSLLTSIITPPILLLLSLPLAIFATFTSILAFSTLCFRASIVYIELAAALIRNHFSPHHISSLDFPPQSSRSKTPASTTLSGHYTQSHTRRRSQVSLHRRSSGGSSSTNGTNNGSITPKATLESSSSGLAVYGGGGATRDFEGVGGWRLPTGPGDEEEDVLWTNMNSRLELPLNTTTTATITPASSVHNSVTASGGLDSLGSPVQQQQKQSHSSRPRYHRRSRTSGSSSSSIATVQTSYDYNINPMNQSSAFPKSITGNLNANVTRLPALSLLLPTSPSKTSTTTSMANLGATRGFPSSKSTTALDQTGANTGRLMVRRPSSGSQGHGHGHSHGHKTSNSSGSSSTTLGSMTRDGPGSAFGLGIGLG